MATATTPQSSTPQSLQSAFLTDQQKQLAQETYNTAVAPLRQTFEDQLKQTNESLAKSGTYFGGLGDAARERLLRDQVNAEAQIAGNIATNLGQTALEQAFQSNQQAQQFEQQKQLQGQQISGQSQLQSQAQTFQASQADIERQYNLGLIDQQQKNQLEFQAVQNQFTADQNEKARQFTLGSQQQQQDFQKSLLDIQQKYNMDNMQYQDSVNKTYQMYELAKSGQLTGTAFETALKNMGIDNPQLFLTDDQKVLQDYAFSKGMTLDQITQARTLLGKTLFEDVAAHPDRYANLALDPQQQFDQQKQLAEISKPVAPKGPSVICTELRRQGKLDGIIYLADHYYGLRLHPDVMAGYHYWAVPLVKCMAKSPLITTIIQPFATAWAQCMAYRMGVTAKNSKFGAMLEVIGLPICLAIGKKIKKKGPRPCHT